MMKEQTTMVVPCFDVLNNATNMTHAHYKGTLQGRACFCSGPNVKYCLDNFKDTGQEGHVRNISVHHQVIPCIIDHFKTFDMLFQIHLETGHVN